MELGDFIDRLVRLPKNVPFPDGIGARNVARYEELDYAAHDSEVTIEAIRTALVRVPELIHRWAAYSADKRYSPSWYFILKDTECCVGYLPHSTEERVHDEFEDRLLACATFIKRDADHFLAIDLRQPQNGLKREH